MNEYILIFDVSGPPTNIDLYQKRYEMQGDYSN